MAHLEKLGLTVLKVRPDPVQIATEGALWGSIAEQGLLDGTVIVSDGAGQFKIAEHAQALKQRAVARRKLCWVHAERLIHKLGTFCEAHVQAKENIRARIWRLYKDLKACRQAPARRFPGSSRPAGVSKKQRQRAADVDLSASFLCTERLRCKIGTKLNLGRAFS